MNSLDRPEQIFGNFRVVTMAAEGAVLARDGLGQPLWTQPSGSGENWTGEPLAIGVTGGRIDWVVPARMLDDQWPEVKRVDGRGALLTPGLIDCHTHLVHAGNRSGEWAARLRGQSYAEIARAGGGILSTVRETRKASENSLLDGATPRLERLVAEGVTTIEIKSGYGLDTESELKMLRVAARLEQRFPVRVVRTLLAAHTVPEEFQGRSDDYVDLVCRETIPAARALCSAVDVFCESIAFDLDQTRRIFLAARDAGLGIRIHAEQLSNSGAARMAAELGALSADHLEHLPPEDCAVLARHGTVATLLPGAWYCLRETVRPPVGNLFAEGVQVAVATDLNPGSSPLVSLLLAANMACALYGLTPEQAFAGITVHAARALGLQDLAGSLEPGKSADFACWRAGSVVDLLYRIGDNPLSHSYFRGEPVVRREQGD